MGSDLLPFSEVTSLVAAVSVLGVFLLLPLYLSQRRDVHRLRDWMQANPDHPGADLAVSERILDSAERDLAKAYADRGEPVPGTMEFEAVKAQTAVKEPGKAEPAAVPLEESLLTSERPALAQVTMERSALEPHPRWKQFVARIMQPRWLAVIAVVALTLGVGGIIVVDRVLRDGGDGDFSGYRARRNRGGGPQHDDGERHSRACCERDRGCGIRQGRGREHRARDGSDHRHVRARPEASREPGRQGAR